MSASDAGRTEPQAGPADLGPIECAGEGPVTGWQLIAVDRIKAYDHNPRRTANPEYHRIKASIRSGGMSPQVRPHE